MQVASIAGSAREFQSALASRPPLPIQQVVLHHLRTPQQIGEISFLRDEIDLSVHAAAGPQFGLLEKKETSAVSSSASNSRANGSARSASCRWVTN